MELGNLMNSDEDVARKSFKMYQGIKDYQNYFQAIEKVTILKSI